MIRSSLFCDNCSQRYVNSSLTYVHISIYLPNGQSSAHRMELIIIILIAVEVVIVGADFPLRCKDLLLTPTLRLRSV